MFVNKEMRFSPVACSKKKGLLASASKTVFRKKCLKTISRGVRKSKSVFRFSGNSHSSPDFLWENQLYMLPVSPLHFLSCTSCAKHVIYTQIADSIYIFNKKRVAHLNFII
jgi:hypothetical protein